MVKTMLKFLEMYVQTPPRPDPAAESTAAPKTLLTSSLVNTVHASALPEGEFAPLLSAAELAEDKSWVGTTAGSSVGAAFTGTLAGAADGAAELPHAAARNTILESTIIIEKRFGRSRENVNLFGMLDSFVFHGNAIT
jgi:hypothetical protein